MNDKDGNIRLGSIVNAITLTKELMQKYNISIDNIIRHYDVTGKDYPRPMIENETLWNGLTSNLIKKSREEKKVKKELR